jgi:hypothetical protein|tara:strand:+ start:1831 stop:2148 length:318 start_codon:yes stop_codon:yes gene_type:complete
MAAVSILEALELKPNSEIKSVLVTVANTTDEDDTTAITLSDHGISEDGLLALRSWVHTTSGSVIVTDIATTSVSSGTLTVTWQSANPNAYRVVELIGRSTPGSFA